MDKLFTYVHTYSRYMKRRHNKFCITLMIKVIYYNLNRRCFTCTRTCMYVDEIVDSSYVTSTVQYTSYVYKIFFFERLLIYFS